MGFEVGDETPKAEAGLVLLHPFNQNQKAQNARWDLVGEKVGKIETPPQNFNLLRKYLVGKCFEKGGVSPLLCQFDVRKDGRRSDLKVDFTPNCATLRRTADGRLNMPDRSHV